MENIKELVDYIFIYATRGSLEDHLKWYYADIGKLDTLKRVSRPKLEELYFIQGALNLNRTGVYSVYLNGKPYRHRYWSASEVMTFLQKNTDFYMSDTRYVGFALKKDHAKLAICYAATDYNPDLEPVLG